MWGNGIDRNVRRQGGWLTVWCCLAAGAFVIDASTVDVAAQDRRFPYDAILDADSDFVRCGPGPKYYPTGKLPKGARVVVHRHDPGGWAMIAPPDGSFSWIQSDYVQKAVSGRGSLTSNNVIVHVGSSLGDERSVYQRTLSRGDAVEVIGEQTFVTERGPVKMYKIKPPVREYRWIAVKSIVPADGRRDPAAPARPAAPKPIPFIQGPIALELETDVAETTDVFAPSPSSSSDSMPGRTPAAPVSSRREPARDPFSNPSDDEPPSMNTASPATPAVSDTAAGGGSLEELRQQLAELDHRFRTMLQAEPQTWDLGSLKAEYLALEKAAGHPAFTSHINQRLGTIQRYSRIQADYVEFHRLTTQTQQRDAELLAQQRQNDARLQAINAQPALANAPIPNPFDQAAAGGQPPQFGSGPGFPGSMAFNGPMSPNGPGAAPPAFASSNPATGFGPPGFGPQNFGQPGFGPEAPGPGNAGPGGPAAEPPKFSGAGIVQRSSIPAPGVPPYILVAPDGRLLAYLEPAPGIDLAQAQNQALGIIGERGFRDELQTDVITVRGFQPVALRAAPVRQ